MSSTPITGATASPTTAEVGQGLASLASDLVSLAELQSELFIYDAKQCVRKVEAPLISLVASAILSLACLPLVIGSGAWLLADLMNWPADLTVFVASLLALLVGAVMGVLCFFRIRKAFNTFDQSMEEFSRNRRWVKDALLMRYSQPSRTPVVPR